MSEFGHKPEGKLPMPWTETAAHKGGQQPLVARQANQHGFHFVPCHDDRQAQGLSGANDFAQVAHLPADDVAVKKQHAERA